jgi:hypothetical protein
LLFQLGGQLQPLETIGPELVDVLAESREALWASAVEAPDALAALVQQPGLPQHGQVLRDGRPGDLEVGCDLACAQLVIPDEAEDLAPARLGERPHRGVDVRIDVRVDVRCIGGGHRGLGVKHGLT